MIQNLDAIKGNTDKNKLFHGKKKKVKRNDKLGINFAIHTLQGCVCAGTCVCNIKGEKKNSKSMDKLAKYMNGLFSENILKLNHKTIAN